jgi:hypothetical protein
VLQYNDIVTNGELVGELLDVKGAFLHGEFETCETLFMEFLEGFAKYYPVGYVLMLLKTMIYGRRPDILEATDHGICKHELCKKQS